MKMKCDKCDFAGPLEIRIGEDVGTAPWPWDWCPFCADRLLSGHDNIATLAMNDIGTMREQG